MSTISHPREKSYYNPNLAEVSYTTFDRVSSSPTKQQYSFGISRTIRFPTVKLRHPNEKTGYDLPSTKKPRAAGFGIGDRFTEQALKLKKSKLNLLTNEINLLLLVD